MLFYISLFVMTFGVFFVTVAIFERGDFFAGAVAAFCGLVAWAILFALVTPALATGVSDEYGVRWKKPVDDKVITSVTGDKVSYTFNSNGESITLDQINNTDDSFLQVIIGVEGQESSYSKTCDETPDWVAPYTMGSCFEQLVVGQ